MIKATAQGLAITGNLIPRIGGVLRQIPSMPTECVFDIGGLQALQDIAD